MRTAMRIDTCTSFDHVFDGTVLLPVTRRREETSNALLYKRFYSQKDFELIAGYQEHITTNTKLGHWSWLRLSNLWWWPFTSFRTKNRQFKANMACIGCMTVILGRWSPVSSKSKMADFVTTVAHLLLLPTTVVHTKLSNISSVNSYRPINAWGITISTLVLQNCFGIFFVVYWCFGVSYRLRINWSIVNRLVMRTPAWLDTAA